MVSPSLGNRVDAILLAQPAVRHRVRLLDVLGGPDYEVRYPNGDRTAYVTTLYEAAIIAGTPAVSDDELSDLAWFAPAQLADLDVSRFTRALFSATGYL
jgi:hypothetical protein